MKDPKAEDRKKNERSSMGMGQVRTIHKKGTQENKGLSDMATCSLIIVQEGVRSARSRRHRREHRVTQDDPAPGKPELQ